MRMTKTSWSTVGTLSVDSGLCAFADIAALSVRIEIPSSEGPIIDLTDRGVPLIACYTRADLDLPVETSDHPPGSRMEFVNDVETIAGQWKRVGKLKLSSDRCIACDPNILQNDFYRVEFELPAGSYHVEIFEDAHGDVLGMRLGDE